MCNLQVAVSLVPPDACFIIDLTLILLYRNSVATQYLIMSNFSQHTLQLDLIAMVSSESAVFWRLNYDDNNHSYIYAV